MTALIELPWPPKQLSPNARLHWRAVHKAKSAYKLECVTLLRPLMPPRVSDGRLPITVTICPPDNRKRDRDNIQASLKYALDCVAKWLGVDDYLFDPSYTFGEPVKGGRISILIGSAEMVAR